MHTHERLEKEDISKELRTSNAMSVPFFGCFSFSRKGKSCLVRR